MHNLLYKEPVKIKVEGINLTYDGIIPRIQKSMLSKDLEAMQPHIRAFVERAVIFTSCPECEGTRLTELARSAKIAGKNIADVCRMEITDLINWVNTIKDNALEPLLNNLKQSLQVFIDIGLGYLSLDRASSSLSGGESQRVKLIRYLGSSLTDITYIFDEPAIGLHPHDIQRLNRLLLQLRDKGNTVLVVEHNPAVIEITDYIVDLGPHGGSLGGQVQYQGDFAEFKVSDTLTAKHLNNRVQVKTSVRQAKGALTVTGAQNNNLKNVTVDFPLGVLTAVTGVAGSGKSSLVRGQLVTTAEITVVDQSPIKGSSRSNPATYAGAMDAIRAAFAKANGVKPALFSANSEGACQGCKGAGMIYTDLVVQAAVGVICEDCEGKRYSAEVLKYNFAGLNIAEVLALPISEAAKFFAGDNPAGAKVPKAAKIITTLHDVGLGYITLGQSLSTLSGGERQRLKLAIAINNNTSIYVLDEPTCGLHPADVSALLRLLDRIVDAGKTVIVIEHNLGFIAHADHVIDMGPGAGSFGGEVVFSGSPQELAKSQTVTGKYLAAYTTK